MTTIADLLQHDPQLLVSHVDDIIPQLLTLAKYKPNLVSDHFNNYCLYFKDIYNDL